MQLFVACQVKPFQGPSDSDLGTLHNSASEAAGIREISPGPRTALKLLQFVSLTQYHLVANGPAPKAPEHILWYLTLGL